MDVMMGGNGDHILDQSDILQGANSQATFNADHIIRLTGKINPGYSATS
jgi:hypothetical protein